ncbi:MAG: ATP-binding protein [Pseudopedobacter sp.]|nr:ATP-binding protein [Deinococcales bacterium]
MITRLKIENFTAFDSLELDFGEGIHAFIGANGTGKTHLLKIMYSLNNGYVHNGSYINIEHFKFFMAFQPNIMNNKSLLRDINRYSDVEVNINTTSIGLRIFANNNVMPKIKSTDDSYESLDNVLRVVFIPVKDMLGNAKGFQSLFRLREISFETVYDDILTRAYLPKLKIPNPNYKPLLEKIEKFIGGKVESRDEEFYLITDKKALELSLVAEGWRKFALLWLLLQNGSLEGGSVLFWDEPEANLNPSALPLLAHILLQLSREGVQVFLATHSYVLLKELDLQKKEHPVNYHSLYFEDGEVRASTAQDYDDIQHNLIEQENVRLYHAELGYLLEPDE